MIDHLWHLTETGYYHRQGGPYPPFTWKIESIVDHKHQKAAYCGIHYFDSDAYPAGVSRPALHGQHPRQLHQRRRPRAQRLDLPRQDRSPTSSRPTTPGSCPSSQKTGPDGCLYILDWYDRYHCYQDANRDPAGIDRLKGRLYRVRYKDTPRRAGSTWPRRPTTS